MQVRKRLVIDVGHPAEVHHYRCFYRELRSMGWRCLFVARDKDVTLSLLRSHHLPYVTLASNRGGILSKIVQLPFIFYRFYRIVRRLRPFMAVSAASLHCSWVCRLLGIPHIAFIDTEYRPMIDPFSLPLIDVKVTPHCYYRRLGRNHFRYVGNHESAYLHPRRFNPDAAVLSELGLSTKESFVMVRFVAWKASHDAGQPRMSDAERAALVRGIAEHKKVFIVSETASMPEWRPFIFPLSPDRALHALAFADIYIGEGTTMAAEAAVLGVPAVLLNSLRVGYCLEAEKHGMLFRYNGFSPQAKLKIEELLSLDHPRSAFEEKHRAFMSDKIDVTSFMTWFVDHYPHSRRELEKEPDYALRFR
ncbi:DUF354 domain-containing protein [candidate division KSB1 bacterium]|nr:DUF354 domain-containing protein [candidate division KSB1 bacterium]